MINTYLRQFPVLSRVRNQTQHTLHIQPYNRNLGSMPNVRSRIVLARDPIPRGFVKLFFECPEWCRISNGQFLTPISFTIQILAVSPAVEICYSPRLHTFYHEDGRRSLGCQWGAFLPKRKLLLLILFRQHGNFRSAVSRYATRSFLPISFQHSCPELITPESSRRQLCMHFVAIVTPILSANGCHPVGKLLVLTLHCTSLVIERDLGQNAMVHRELSGIFSIHRQNRNTASSPGENRQQCVQCISGPVVWVVHSSILHI